MGTTGDIEHAAILFADVKGYSVLISRDEVGTYERLRRARALFRALVGNYGGRIVDEAGDGVLAAFPDAGQAVDFALAVQRDLANAAAWQGESGPFAFRMGVHTGPVYRDGQRLFGKTLVVAQRIQEVAPPGRICVSDAVREGLSHRTELRCVSMGARQLKNLGPVPVHRVETADLPAALELSPLAAESGCAAGDDAAIAVLPFENQSSDLTDSLLCDGMTTDVIERLSRFRDLAIIARHSAFQCRSLIRVPSDVGQVLGARYVAVGAVRRAGGRLRVTAQLLDADSGRLLWSDRFDGIVADVFDFQDEVADMIASRLATQVSDAERRRIIANRAPKISAYGLVLRGEDLMIRFRQETNAHARHLFNEAASLDPSYARVYAGLSHALSQCWLQRWVDDPAQSLNQAIQLAQEAITRDAMDARGYAELGYAHLYKKNHQQSLAAYERAVDLNPNDADVLAYMADTLGAMGQSDRAVQMLERAIRLNPYHPDWYLWQLGDVLFDLERYEEAITTLAKMRDPTGPHRLLAASHALLGNLTEARHHAEEVLRAHPDFSLERWKDVPPDTNTVTLQRYFDGLRLAGLP